MHNLRLTSPERVLWAEQGLTKVDLATYYAKVAPWALPHLVDRPLAILRCPAGRAKHCFFQKHATDALPREIHGVEIEEKAGRACCITIRDLFGLVALVQISALEIHPWGARVDRIERPDRLVLDLDPGPGVAWRALSSGARQIRERLAAHGLESFLRTTGGKGLHVVAPIARRSSWDELQRFARGVALAMARDAPEQFVATMAKREREGRIFVDYLRNSRGATAIASYSTRARPGAPVAMPLAWDELGRLRSADAFDPARALRRVQRGQDPWQGFFDVRQSI
jgi:bifunctional non-homologous end joining protein LigD